MKTIEAMTARAMNGIITLKTWSEFVAQASTPWGRPETIEAKIISEMPLPMPRWVISSPIHIRRIVPAVSDVTMMNTCARSKSGMIGEPPDWLPRKRKT